jgi:hypothetical protein
MVRRVLFLFVVLAGMASPVFAGVRFDSASVVFHFRGANSSAHVGGFIVPLGDINGDGYDDIAVSCRVPRGTYIFYGSADSDSIPDIFLPGQWVPFGTIDVTGDGINDLLASNDTTLWIYKGYGDSISSVPFDSICPTDSIPGFTYPTKMAYFDSDSLGDFLVTSYGNSPDNPTYYLLLGCPAKDCTPIWTYTVNDYSYAAGGADFIDFNGDGDLDFVLGFYGDKDTLGYLGVFLGPTPGSIPDIIILPPEGIPDLDRQHFPNGVVNIGDFNADGWDDLGVTGHVVNSKSFVYYCGPGADTLPDLTLQWFATNMASAGDFNGDGYDDVVCGGSGGYGGVVLFYYGGPRVDSTFDAYCSYDISPGSDLFDIGYRVSPAGDFNGDGYDDFMFSCHNMPMLGEYWDVFVMAGSNKILVDVTMGQPPPRPTDVEVKQNYPNPFNPATTIEFTLPRADYIEVRIYNLLGEVVAIPMQGFLTAGNHRVEWDGLSLDGKPASSGIYFYRLTGGSYSDTRKMILMK